MPAISRTNAEMRAFLLERSTPVTETGCHIWLFHADKDGYGRIRHLGRDWRVHRLSYELHVGPLVPGQMVLHICDVPSCINPRHLVQGSPLENMTDKIRKGRLRVAFGNTHYRRLHPKKWAGDNCAAAKLNSEHVLDIRRRLDAGEDKGSLAKIFGVTKGAIHAIATRRNWNHI